MACHVFGHWRVAAALPYEADHGVVARKKAVLSAPRRSKGSARGHWEEFQCLPPRTARGDHASPWPLTRSKRSSNKAEQALDHWPSFARAVARSSLFWTRPRRRLGLVGSRGVLACIWEGYVVSARAPWAPLSHSSHCLPVSFEELFLFCVPPTFSVEHHLRNSQKICPGSSVAVGGGL